MCSSCRFCTEHGMGEWPGHVLTHPSAPFPFRWLFAWLRPSLSLSSNITSAGKLFLTIVPQETPSLVILHFHPPNPFSTLQPNSGRYHQSSLARWHNQVLTVGSSSSRLEDERRKRLGFFYLLLFYFGSWFWLRLHPTITVLPGATPSIAQAPPFLLLTP